MTPSRTYRQLTTVLMNSIDRTVAAYVELRVTTRCLVEAGLLHLGAVGTAAGSAEKRLACKGPARGYGGN
jgi:hypothetical protein